MKQEDLKLLAKWVNIDLMQIEESEDLATTVNYDINDIKGRLPDKLWQPHKDSNQLDQLEDKMINNAKIFELKMMMKEKEWVHVYYYGYEGDFPIEGTGKTKNEARLNAILNYVEKK